MNPQTAFVKSPFVVLRNYNFNEEIDHFYGKIKAFMKNLPFEILRSMGEKNDNYEEHYLKGEPKNCLFYLTFILQ